MSFILYNGIAFHGIAFNGIAFKEIAFKRIAFNGIAFNGIASNGVALSGVVLSQNKISLNTGILLKNFLILRLFNSPLASSFLINLDFLVLHTTHFDNIYVPPFIAFETNGLMLFLFSPHFRQ